MNIDISKHCIGCGRCVKVCPANLFSVDEEKKQASITEPEKCIVCGHCVAACPAEAISHEEFPKEKIHAFDRKSLPDADAVELLIRSRRSNRAFTKEPVDRTALQRIVEAGHRAPTASNLQQVKMVVVTDPEVIRQIIDITVKHFEKLLNILENPVLKPILKTIMPGNYRYVPSFRRMVKKRRNGDDPILRNATAAIFFYTPEDCRFGCEDSNLAYQNASLMAEALGISQFYTGFVCNAEKMKRKKDIARLLHIEGTIRAGMGLGNPDFRFSRYIDKKDLEVKWL